MAKAVIVVSNPLSLMNCIELVYDLGIAFEDTAVFFIGKNHNKGKLIQAKKIIASFPFLQYFIFIRHYPSLYFRQVSLFSRFLRMLFGRVEERLNCFFVEKYVKTKTFGYEPELISGSGIYFYPVKRMFKSASVWIVDSGVSSVWGKIARQLSEREKVFSVYDAETLGVPNSLLKRNENKMQIAMCSKLPLHKSVAIFISANQAGSSTKSQWYDRSLLKARQIHDGKILYYRRANEPIAEAKYICDRHGFDLVDINWPVEWYLGMELGFLPGRVISVGSSSLKFFSQIPAEKGIEVVFLLPAEHPRSEKLLENASVFRKRESCTGSPVRFVSC